MSYTFNNQEVANTFINYTQWKTHVGKHAGRETVNKIKDFKEENLMYTGANILFAKLFDSIIYYCMVLKMFQSMLTRL